MKVFLDYPCERCGRTTTRIACDAVEGTVLSIDLQLWKRVCDACAAKDDETAGPVRNLSANEDV